MNWYKDFFINSHATPRNAYKQFINTLNQTIKYKAVSTTHINIRCTICEWWRILAWKRFKIPVSISSGKPEDILSALCLVLSVLHKNAKTDSNNTIAKYNNKPAMRIQKMLIIYYLLGVFYNVFSVYKHYLNYLRQTCLKIQQGSKDAVQFFWILTRTTKVHVCQGERPVHK